VIEPARPPPLSDKTYRASILFVAFAAALVARWIRAAHLGDVPHVQDEFAYVLQAKTYALGQLASPPLLPRAAFNMWFVEDRLDRFGIFPPGWPMVLAAFVKLGLANWANPLLHGATVLVVAHAGRRCASNLGGIVAALLYASSPQTLLVASSLMSHGLVALASAAAAVVVIGVLDRPQALTPRVAAATGVLFGCAVLTRPLCATVLGAALFGAFAWRVWTKKPVPRTELAIVALGGVLGALAFAMYDGALTGAASYAPQSMYFDSHFPPANLPLFNYHRGCNALGFGEGHGCDFSISGAAHSLQNAASNTGDNVRAWVLLLGGGPVVLVLAAIGIVVPRDAKHAIFGATVVLTLVAYALYWYAGTCYGARFYHLAVPFVMLLATAALQKLAARNVRAAAVVLAGIVLSNVVVCRAAATELHDYWGTDRRFAQVKETWTKGPALVMVAFDLTDLTRAPPPEEPLFWTTQLVRRGFWMPNVTANAAIGLNDPELRDHVVFAKFHPGIVAQLHARFPERALWLYTATASGQNDRLTEWDPAVLPAALPVLAPPDNFDGYDFSRPFLGRAEGVPALEAP
jgi:hypothetical protein